MKLTFLGATQTVTGSKYLVEAGNCRFLIDSGLFQGLKPLRQRNWEPFPIPPSSLDAIILTHAHIDHTGFLPRLYKEGYRGPVYVTKPTYDLCTILLPDAGYLQEEDARFANKHGYSKHRPALPLYTEEAARAALSLFRTIDYNTSFSLGGGLNCTFTPTGHILGAASVHIQEGKRRLVFSGDVGRPNDLLMHPPRPLEHADYLVLESTYGNRRHEAADPKERFAAIIESVVSRNGVLLIPSFAVGRAQTVLYVLYKLRQEGRIPDIPVYLDSPMAIEATELFCRHAAEHKLSAEEAREMCRGVTYVRTSEESKLLSRRGGPMIIISASGMATGGRVLHHLKAFAPDPNNTVLFVGFQAAGTRGRAMLAGAREVKIHGGFVPIAAEVESIESLSAHADYEELIGWLSRLQREPHRIFLVHGETEAQKALTQKLRDAFGWDAESPEFGQQVVL